MTVDKRKKIEAYRDLMKMKDYFHLCYGETRQEELDKSLMDFGVNGIPVSLLNVNLVDKQNRITRLMIEAGANPNVERMGLFHPESVFETFMQFGNLKPHCALEIAKADGFKRPRTLDNIFLRLTGLLEQQIKYGKTFWDDYHETVDAFELRKKLCSYGQTLVYTLFEKGMKPKDPEVLKSLQPIYVAEKERQMQENLKKIGKIAIPKKIKYGDAAMKLIKKLDQAYANSRNSQLVFGPGSFPRDEGRGQKTGKKVTRSERS